MSSRLRIIGELKEYGSLPEKFQYQHLTTSELEQLLMRLRRKILKTPNNLFSVFVSKGKKAESLKTRGSKGIDLVVGRKSTIPSTMKDFGGKKK